MGVFDRLKNVFGRSDGPYEEALRERVEEARQLAGPDADEAMLVKAAVSVVSGREIDEIASKNDFIDDLAMGDLEMMEVELLCGELLGVKLSRDDMDRVDTVGDLAVVASRKAGGKPIRGGTTEKDEKENVEENEPGETGKE